MLGNPAPVAMPSEDVCYSCGCPFPSFEDWEPENIPDGDVMNFDPVNGQMYCEKCRPDLFEQIEQIKALNIA
jgi:hypothetical protein